MCFKIAVNALEVVKSQQLRHNLWMLTYARKTFAHKHSRNHYKINFNAKRLLRKK